MTITDRTLILSRSNLKTYSYNKDIQDIEISDFVVPVQHVHQANMVIYIDDGGQSKVFKNRYGPTPKPVEEDDMVITVASKPGYGKTSISVLISNLLKQIGIENVKIEDDVSTIPSVEIVSRQAKYIRDRVKNVTIKAQQIRR